MTQICVSKLTIIGSDSGLSPDRRQAIMWTHAGILLSGPKGTSFNELFIQIHTFSFKKIHFKMSSEKWRPFCLDLNVFTVLVQHPPGQHLRYWDGTRGTDKWIAWCLGKINDYGHSTRSSCWHLCYLLEAPLGRYLQTHRQDAVSSFISVYSASINDGISLLKVLPGNRISNHALIEVIP